MAIGSISASGATVQFEPLAPCSMDTVRCEFGGKPDGFLFE